MSGIVNNLKNKERDLNKGSKILKRKKNYEVMTSKYHTCWN